MKTVFAFVLMSIFASTAMAAEEPCKEECKAAFRKWKMGGSEQKYKECCNPVVAPPTPPPAAQTTPPAPKPKPQPRPQPTVTPVTPPVQPQVTPPVTPPAPEQPPAINPQLEALQKQLAELMEAQKKTTERLEKELGASDDTPVKTGKFNNWMAFLVITCVVLFIFSVVMFIVVLVGFKRQRQANTMTLNMCAVMYSEGKMDEEGNIIVPPAANAPPPP